jgi:CheY-like chemotaxis protein
MARSQSMLTNRYPISADVVVVRNKESHEREGVMGRILVIDDDPLIRRTLQDLLESGGHDVTLAVHGADGLEKWETESYDLIILDILMPEKEGLETLRQMRQVDGRTAVIAMTGGLSGRNAARPNAPPLDYLRMAENLGATRTLRKPFTGRQLLSLVQECLPATRRVV